MADNILEVSHLKKYFDSPKGIVHAVDDVSFSIERGKTLGIVGESGCGKSTTGRSIIRLIEPTSGSVKFDGVELTTLNKNEMRKMRKNIQLIFQDPYASLDPRKSVSEIIAEPIKLNKILTDKKAIDARVNELMDTVGLAQRLVNAYPHELDGGRRQRIGIARAIAMEPKLIICDEPVSALDVSIQAQILNLLKKLQEQMGLTYIFITHDLAVVNHFSDDIAVMYLGQLVEKAPSEELFANPLHPYTEALLSAIPVPDLKNRRQRIKLKGEITSPINLPDECRFAKRCEKCFDKCTTCDAKLKEVSPNHFVACHLFD